MCLRLFLILLGFCPSIIIADYKATGSLEWKVKAVPGFLSIHQTNGKLGCILKGEKVVKIECKAHLEHIKDNSFDLRADHAKEWMTKADEVTYSWPSLVIDKFEIKDGEQSFEGMLTVKKETKPVKGKITLKGLKGKGEFVVKISDYPSIGKPSYKGIGVQDNVTVMFELEAK